MIYLTIGAVLLAVVGLAVWLARRGGTNDARADASEQGLKDVRKAQEARAAVDRLPVGGAADELRKHYQRD